jgi:diguanylate cyclase (GGDEF)-like protein
MLRDLNEALAEASTHDALTGLPNRRRMTERLRETHALQQRTGLSWCVAMLDVDHFKKVNDTHGHDAGDVVLVQVSRVLQAGLRGSDACARWGGEEFMVLLTDTQLGAATEVLNRLRESIASRDVVANGEVLRVTASLGVAQGRRGEPYSEALKRADEALYRAKRSGRNRVECEADAAAES